MTAASKEILTMMMDLHGRTNTIMEVFEGNAELAFMEGDMNQSLGCASAAGILACISTLITSVTHQFEVAKEANDGKRKSTIEG